VPKGFFVRDHSWLVIPSGQGGDELETANGGTPQDSVRASSDLCDSLKYDPVRFLKLPHVVVSRIFSTKEVSVKTAETLIDIGSLPRE